MTKTLLRDINKINDQRVKDFNGISHSRLEAINMGTKVGKLKLDEARQYQEAVEKEDVSKVFKLLDSNNMYVSEVYYNMPDIIISNNGSIKSLKVSIYASEQEDKRLLHRLFNQSRKRSLSK